MKNFIADICKINTPQRTSSERRGTDRFGSFFIQYRKEFYKMHSSFRQGGSSRLYVDSCCNHHKEIAKLGINFHSSHIYFFSDSRYSENFKAISLFYLRAYPRHRSTPRLPTIKQIMISSAEDGFALWVNNLSVFLACVLRETKVKTPRSSYFQYSSLLLCAQ